MNIKNNTTTLQNILDTVKSLPKAESSSSSSIIVKESECVISNGEIIVPGEYVDFQSVENSLIGCIAYANISFTNITWLLCMNAETSQFVDSSGNIAFNPIQRCTRFETDGSKLYWNVDPEFSVFTDNVTKFRLYAFLRQ